MKKIICSILTLVMILSTVCVNTVSAAETVNIGTAAELISAAAAINASSNGGEGTTYNLTADINLGGALWSTIIGSEAKPFKGTFDGNGHVITNYKFNCTENSGVYYGLFGVVGGNGHITCLGVEKVSANIPAAWCYPDGYGAIAGKLTDNAKISECYAKKISLSLSHGNGTNGNFEAAGAIAAIAEGSGVTVESCYSTGSIFNEAEANYDAGIVGMLMSWNKIDKCYSDSTIGRIGKTDYPSRYNEGTISNCYYVANAPWPAGDYVGEKTAAGDLASKISNLGSAFVSISGAAPILKWEQGRTLLSGSGTASDPYLVSTSEDLENVAAFGTAENLYFRLENNIDLNGAVWNGFIGTDASPFKGKFDGNGKIISNFILNPLGGMSSGLFGVIGGNAEIHDLGVKDVYVEQLIDGWEVIAGGMVGKVTDKAKITSCFVKDIKMIGTFTEGGERFAYGGGLAGQLKGSGAEIKNCYVLNWSSNGKINNDSALVGGTLSGEDKITNCYANAMITIYLNATSPDSVITNTYYSCSGNLPWPYAGSQGNQGSAYWYGYAGTRVEDSELKALAPTLGAGFAADTGRVNSGYPLLSWEEKGEISEMVGDGSQANPYKISNVYHLALVSEMTETDGKYFELTNDIDFGGSVWSETVGTANSPFKGSFNGNGYAFKNYKINAVPNMAKGIFGVVGGNAVIEKTGTIGSSAELSIDGWETAYGALIGRLTDNARISECYSRKAYIKTNYGGGRFKFGGGLIGTIDSAAATVTNCYSVGSEFVGDIDNDAGLVGGVISVDPVITNCYTDMYLVRFGKGMGKNTTNCYYVADAPWPGTNPTDSAGWYAGTKVDEYTMKNKAADLGSAYVRDITAENSGYPIFTWQAKSAEIEGEGTYANPFLIKSKADLAYASINTNTEGIYYRLENDIDLGGEVWATYFGALETIPFKGDFDGNGHVIRNYNIELNSDISAGLFAYVSGEAYIHDLGIKNVKVILKNQYSWKSSAGALVGKITDNADIERCFVKNVDFSASFTRTSELGEIENGGGMVGFVYGEGVEIRNCYSQGYSETVASGGLKINNNDGGLLGRADNAGMIENCYSDTTIGRILGWIPSKNCYVNSNGAEWPDGYTWPGLIMSVTGIGYNWSSDFIPNNDIGPSLKWENSNGYRQLVPGGNMSISARQANYMFGISGAEILTGREHRDGSTVLKLPANQTLKYPVDLTAGEYYRVSFKVKADTKTDISWSLGARDLAAELRDATADNTWKTKAVFVKAAESGIQNLAIGAANEMLVDDVKVMKVNADTEAAALNESIDLSYQKLDVIDCDIKLDQTICDGIEVIYNSESIDEYGRLTEKRPIGFGTLEEQFAATARVDDITVSKSMNVKIVEREPIDILDMGLLDADGNAVYGIETAARIGTVELDINAEGKNAVLYAALYKNGKLVNLKTATVSGTAAVLNMPVENADKIKMFVLEKNTAAPLAKVEETGDILSDSAKVTIRTIGDSICQTYENNTPLKGWGQKIGNQFTSNVTVDNTLSRSGMSAYEFLMNEENRFGKLMARLEKGDYVLIQLSHNDRGKGTKDEFRLYLNQFISGARQKGATPVLITPPDEFYAATNTKAADGIHYVAESKLLGYPDVMRELAAERNVPLIDFNRECLDLMAEVGLDGIRETGYFIGTDADPLHFTSAGAEWIASSVAKGLEKLGLPIAKFIKTSDPDLTGVNVLSAENATFKVASSAGTKTANEAVDGDIVTAVGIGDYNGEPIFDINGENGGEYIMLMTAEVKSPVRWSVSN